MNFERRKTDPNGKRRRALFDWTVSYFMVENPNCDVAVVKDAAREVWKFNHNKVLYLASVNELLFVVGQVYLRKIRQNQTQKPLALTHNNVIKLSERRGNPNGR